MSARRSPLSWPAGWPRTQFRVSAAFGKGQRYYKPDGSPGYMGKTKLSAMDAALRLTRELALMGADDVVLSTDLRLRLDGLPRSDQPEPTDPGAAVYFVLAGKPVVLACDKWTRVADNIAALAAHVAAMRGMERWGVGSLAQAFAGYTALPPKGGDTDWRAVLGFQPDQNGTPTLYAVEARFKELARLHHPDVGGNAETFSRMTEARDAARRELAPR